MSFAPKLKRRDSVSLRNSTTGERFLVCKMFIFLYISDIISTIFMIYFSFVFLPFLRNNEHGFHDIVYPRLAKNSRIRQVASRAVSILVLC